MDVAAAIAGQAAIEPQHVAIQWMTIRDPAHVRATAAALEPAAAAVTIDDAAATVEHLAATRAGNAGCGLAQRCVWSVRDAATIIRRAMKAQRAALVRPAGDVTITDGR